MAPQFWALENKLRLQGIGCNMGAFVIRIGCWGPLYNNYIKEPPKKALVVISAPVVDLFLPSQWPSGCQKMRWVLLPADKAPIEAVGLGPSVD